jgi:predicted esterase YcpF (UPF0227 family)
VTKLEAMQQAEQHVKTAYQILRHSGFDGAHALERLYGIVFDSWSHSVGLVTQAIGGWMS